MAELQPEMFCPVHNRVLQDIRDIEAKQDARHCLSHEAQLHSIYDSTQRIEADNKDQWKAINQLRRLVWAGTGIMALIGSVIGNIVINYLQGKP